MLAFASAVLAAVAGAVALAEAEPFLNAGVDDKTRRAALLNHELKPASSFLTHKIVLDDCYLVLVSVLHAVSPAASRAALAERCRMLATQSVDAAPSNGYAWHGLAMAAADLGDLAALNRGLVRSQATAPNERWLASLRVALAEAHLGELDRETTAAHEADLRLMAQSVTGRADLARRHVGDPAFAVRITALVEQLPEVVQSQFVQSVRNAAAAQGLTGRSP